MLIITIMRKKWKGTYKVNVKQGEKTWTQTVKTQNETKIAEIVLYVKNLADKKKTRYRHNDKFALR